MVYVFFSLSLSVSVSLSLSLSLALSFLFAPKFIRSGSAAFHRKMPVWNVVRFVKSCWKRFMAHGHAGS